MLIEFTLLLLTFSIADGHTLKFFLNQPDCSAVFLQSLFEERFEVTDTINCVFQTDTSLLCESELLGDLETFDYIVTVGRNIITAIDEIDGVSVREYGRNICGNVDDLACITCGEVSHFRPLVGFDMNISNLALRLINELGNGEPTPPPLPPVIVSDIVVDGRTIFAITGLILGIVSLLVLFVSRVNNEFEIPVHVHGNVTTNNNSTFGLLVEASTPNSFFLVLERMLTYRVHQIRERRTVSEMERTVEVFKSLDSSREYVFLNIHRRNLGAKYLRNIERNLRTTLNQTVALEDACEHFIDYLCTGLLPKDENLQRISNRALPTNPIRSYLLGLVEGLRNWLTIDDEITVEEIILSVLLYADFILEEIKERCEIRPNIRNFKGLFGAILFVSVRIVYEEDPVILKYWAEISKISMDALYDFETLFHKDSGIRPKCSRTAVQELITKIGFPCPERASL